jgi:serine/threonine protein kinase
MPSIFHYKLIAHVIASFDSLEHKCLKYELFKENLMQMLSAKNKSLVLEGVRDILKQMRQALNYLQALQITHTNIKGENVVLVNAKTKLVMKSGVSCCPVKIVACFKPFRNTLVKAQ